jgi:type VII secretion protein EccE
VAGAGTAPWTVAAVAAVVAMSPPWAGHVPAVAVGAVALVTAVAGFLPSTGGARWFRFLWRRWIGLRRCPAAGWQPPVVLRGQQSGQQSSGPTASGVAPQVDVLLHAGRLLAVVELRSMNDPRSPTSGLQALEPLLSSAGVVVESIQWLQVSTRGRGRQPAGGRWQADDRVPRSERTLVVLRLDLGGNELSIQARGGGELGARRLLAVTVARAVSLLASSGARPRVLDGLAALRVMREVAGTPAPVRPGTSRRSEARPVELRDRLVLGRRQHRSRHWSGGSGTSDDCRFEPVEALYGADGGPVPSGTQPAQIVRSAWIRAGCDGVRRGGALRLSAGSVAELDVLDRALRERVPADSVTLRDAIDDQAALFVSTLPYGGPP